MIEKATVILVVLSVVVWSGPALRGLDPDRAVTQYNIDTWNDASGLPQNSVRAVLQTRDGYLWIGTEEGLARFDGVTFTVFDEDNTPEITDNFIRQLFEDREGNLWIASRGGLLFYKNGTFERFPGKEGFSNDLVYSLCEDLSNNLLVGTDGAGLYRLKGGSFVTYTEKTGLPDNTVKDIYCDGKGSLWVATKGGLSRLREEGILNYTEADGLPSERVNTVYEDSNNIIWLGTDNGLAKLEDGKIAVFLLDADASKQGEICTIFEDSDKNLWIGTEKNGLFRYRDGELENLSVESEAGLSSNTIRSIAEDREGNLWLGTVYGGLHCLKDTKFTTFGRPEGLSHDHVFSIFEDSRGYMWVGTDSGLNRMKPGTGAGGNGVIHFTTADGLTNNGITPIFEAPPGFIWVGTDDGLNRLRSSEKGIFKLSEYLRNDFILALSGDGDGNLWIGTLRGLVTKRGPDEERFNKDNGLVTNVVNFVHKDRDGNLWLSTHGWGLTKYRDGKFTVFNREKDGLAGDSIGCIYEDDDGVLWIGTSGGLSRLKDEVFTNCTKQEGLFNNNIYQILEDNNGNFWMSCNKGIFRVGKKAVIDCMEGKISKVESVSYGKEDGMRSIECNGGYPNAGCKTKDGKLWFPTAKGIVIVDPSNIKVNSVRPPVYIEEVLLDGAAAGPGEEIAVNPGIKRVEIHYTALSFVNPQRVKFKYRLEGYEEHWVDADTQRVAFYTNLDAGSYRFRVAACNDDGLWNEEGAWISFNVIAPFSQTWWFRFLAMAVFAVFSYLVINFARRFISLSRFWKKQKYVGSFRLLDKLASGGMGTVYKARNLSDKNEIVAIKVLKEELLEDESNRKRFKQEAAIIDQLDHPNIIRVFERGQTKETMFIAMELLEGKTLTQKIEAEERLDLKEGLHIMIQIVDAAAKIHSKDIVHRDLKPDNIMLIEKDGDPNFVKLLDFGLAKTQYQTRLTQTGMVIGTINYMAPEQISGSEFSGATDVYSMGVMFFEMLTGEKPFIGETTIDLMKQILDRVPIEPIRYRFDIPEELNDLILEMMEKESDVRPHVEDVLETLRRIRLHLETID